jgi:uncharacterized protein
MRIGAPMIRNFSSATHAAIVAFALLLSGLIASPAHAQFGEGFQLLEAVEKDEMAKAEKLLMNAGPTLINTRKTDSGMSGLHIAVDRKDDEWTIFLLRKGANPNITDKVGNSPLILAAQKRYVEGARFLLTVGAKVNLQNDSGETALIRAVQLRDLTMVKLLMSKGADPDIVDNIAGQSARDYAAADRRMPALLAALDAKPADTAATAKP